MPDNKNLSSAAKNKNDEFYTIYDDIQRELNCYISYDPNVFKDKTILLPCDDPEWSNFTKFFVANFNFYKMKKLISTSYAANSKKFQMPVQLSLWEKDFPQYDPKIDDLHGKIFEMTECDREKFYLDNLQWRYLEGDGDFRSDEVKKLFAEADIIVTNPPFSLFREFLKQIMDFGKKFLIIGNINCITYKEVFPLIMQNKIWLGPSISSGDRKFFVPDDYLLEAATCGIDERGHRFINVKGVRWFTNLNHFKRNEPLMLMTMAQVIRYSKHKTVRGKPFQKYDNYDAIEVPFVDAIPNDYDGVMGVPITFLDKYCPEQFEILGMAKRGAGDPALRTKIYTKEDYPNYSDLNAGPVLNIDGVLKNTYPRILIRHRR